jgi:hypothetical protein
MQLITSNDNITGLGAAGGHIRKGWHLCTSQAFVIKEPVKRNFALVVNGNLGVVCGQTEDGDIIDLHAYDVEPWLDNQSLIRWSMSNHGLSANNLADEMGIRRETVFAWVNGTRRPSKEARTYLEKRLEIKLK